MKNQKYKKPKITAVELDSSQAVLAVCARYAAPGAWMSAAVCVYSITGDSLLTWCGSGARGAARGTNGFTTVDNESAGS